MYVKPAAGLRVFDPVRKQFMPDEGMEVDNNDFYWVRRVRDGDVVKIAQPVDAVSKPASGSGKGDSQ